MTVLRLVSSSAVARGSGAIAQLAVTVAVARLCGSEEAGLYFLGFSILAILATATRLGCELSALRDAARLFSDGDGDGLRAAVRARLWLVLVLGTACGVALAAAAPAIGRWTVGEKVAPSILMAGLALPALALLGVLAEVLKGMQRAHVGLLMQNTLVPVLTLALLLFLQVAGGVDSVTASASMCGSTWLAAGLAWIVWRRAARLTFGQAAHGRPLWPSIRALASDAGALLPVAAAPVVMQWVGSTVLGFLAEPADIAGYSVAVRISIAVSIVHSAAASVVGPQMSVAHSAGDAPALRRVCHQTSLIIAAITWPVLWGMILLAPQILEVFEQGFGRYSGVLQVLLIGQLVAALIGHSGLVLVMAGRYRMARSTSAVAVGSLAVLAAVLTSKLGVTGMAVGMSAAVVLGHLAGLFLVRKALGVWTIPLTPLDLARVRHAGAS